MRVALETTDWPDVSVTPTICFMKAENWSLLSTRPLRFGGVYVLWGKALGKLIRAKGSLSIDEIEALERELALVLPPA